MSDIHIGRRIRELRELQNDTRESLSEKIGISSKFLYEIETGKKGFSIDILRRISESLTVSCDYIIFGEEKYKDDEKTICALKRLEAIHIRQIQDMTKVLYEILDIAEV